MRTLLLLLTALLAACSSMPKAPPLTNEVGYLDQKTTRQLVEHWIDRGYPDKIAGRPIQLFDAHPVVDPILHLTPANSFTKDDKDTSHLGTLAMLHTTMDQLPKKITPRAWQLTNQPTTIVASSEQDGSLKLTALDFREEQNLSGIPLANNFRMPFHYIKKQEDSSNAIARLLTLVDPSSWSDRRGFYLATQYDPDKIPLIFIHGLLSTPVDFERLASAIASEPDLWERYQLWYYFYPTGDPWVLTAANFREDFRLLAKTIDPHQEHLPLREKTTIIAHSMGGLITRLSLSEQSQTLYEQYFTRPLDDIRLLPFQKKRLREQLLFEPLTEPSKVIFLATPHKGSNLAGGPLHWLARNLVKAPARILGTTLSAAQLIAFAETESLTKQGAALLAGNEVSVSGLRPDSVALKALNQMPIRQGVELHNIVATLTGGQRGLGDWVVPYTSASLDQAHTQTIVRSGHWLIRDPETTKEVIKLLRQ